MCVCVCLRWKVLACMCVKKTCLHPHACARITMHMYIIIHQAMCYHNVWPNNGQGGDEHFVHCSEVVPSSEVEMYGQLMAGGKQSIGGFTVLCIY